MYRKDSIAIGEWIKNSNKALLVTGARQIGKTTLIREFGKNEYEYFAELNFVTDERAADIFNGKLTAEAVITNLTAYLQTPLEPGKTLILFDEVQECPRVRSAIKFLVEDGRFDYIESGSLLGVRYKEVPSYAVGYEEICYMYPMDFEEYIRANGVQDSTIELLKTCYSEHSEVPEVVHQTMLKLFYTYIVVGGMPAVVQIYVNTHDIGKVVALQREILELYRLDIGKYAEGSDKIKIRAIFDSIPAQLNSKNRRFILNKIDDKGRMNRYENAFLWLSDAGVALPSYNIEEPQPPLRLNEKRNLFKLFMGDTGLLCAACMENIQFALLNGNMEVNMGSILENVFAQIIKSNGFSLNYFESKKYGELDFVIQNGMEVDLLEIKSGKDYKKHFALSKVSAVENWEFGRKIIFCSGNVEEEEGMEYLPWYLAMFYQVNKEPKEYKYEVDLSGLL